MGRIKGSNKEVDVFPLILIEESLQAYFNWCDFTQDMLTFLINPY